MILSDFWPVSSDFKRFWVIFSQFEAIKAFLGDLKRIFAILDNFGRFQANLNDLRRIWASFSQFKAISRQLQAILSNFWAIFAWVVRDRPK